MQPTRQSAGCRLTFSLRPVVAASIVTEAVEEPLIAPFNPFGKNRPLPFLPPPVTTLMTCSCHGLRIHATAVLCRVDRSKVLRFTLGEHRLDNTANRCSDFRPLHPSGEPRC